MQDVLEFRENMPERFRKNYDKAMGLNGRRKSRANAVKAKCLDCTCWKIAEIKNCSVKACPLYPFRPFVKKDGSHEGATGSELKSEG